jgi:hypothetical protein
MTRAAMAAIDIGRGRLRRRKILSVKALTLKRNNGVSAAAIAVFHPCETCHITVT